MTLAPDLASAVARVPGWNGATGRLTPLDGGITNRNWRVDVPAATYVLRLGGRNTEMLGIDRQGEIRFAQAAARAGIGPAVVVADAQADLLVTSWIAGRPLTPQLAAVPATLAAVGRTLARLHAISIDQVGAASVFSPFEIVRRYGAIARERGVSFPPEASEALAIADRIEAGMWPPKSLVPCHNDLLGANFILDADQVRIIDWEYAALGHPYFDLGNFATNLELSSDAECHLLAAYSGEPIAPDDIAVLRQGRLASDLREAFWGFLQAAISHLDFDFMRHGQEHLGRFLAQAAGSAVARGAV
jgi:thiamine kinase-like enzyme